MAEKAAATIQWGNVKICYALERANRKTIAITVTPDGAVLVRAPFAAESQGIERIVVRRAAWITRQQNFFAQFRPRTTPREYIGGETHLYLGRRYRLRIRNEESSGVTLKNGYLCISSDVPTPDKVKELLEKWYSDRAAIVFTERLMQCRRLPAFADLPEPALTNRRLRLRWGSCTASGKIILNTDLIRAPRACIDYVIVHELCHLLHHNHSAAFYRTLSAVMPDWEDRKTRLERLLS